jgi:hypothetical protein
VTVTVVAAEETLAASVYVAAACHKVDFSLAELSKCDFRDAKLEGCSLAEGRHQGSRHRVRPAGSPPTGLDPIAPKDKEFGLPGFWYRRHWPADPPHRRAKESAQTGSHLFAAGVWPRPLAGRKPRMSYSA